MINCQDGGSWDYGMDPEAGAGRELLWSSVETVPRSWSWVIVKRAWAWVRAVKSVCVASISKMWRSERSDNSKSWDERQKRETKQNWQRETIMSKNTKNCIEKTDIKQTIIQRRDIRKHAKPEEISARWKTGVPLGRSGGVGKQARVVRSLTVWKRKCQHTEVVSENLTLINHLVLWYWAILSNSLSAFWLTALYFMMMVVMKIKMAICET